MLSQDFLIQLQLAVNTASSKIKDEKDIFPSEISYENRQEAKTNLDARIITLNARLQDIIINKPALKEAARDVAATCLRIMTELAN